MLEILVLCSLSLENMTSPEKMEQRTAIKFYVKDGMTPSDTWKFISIAENNQKCSRSLIFNRHKRFTDGRAECRDNKLTGRPSITEKKVQTVKAILSNDRRRSIDEISNELGISHGGVHKIIKENLNMNKVAARWVSSFA